MLRVLSSRNEGKIIFSPDRDLTFSYVYQRNMKTVGRLHERNRSGHSFARNDCTYKSTGKIRIFLKKSKKLLAIRKEISYTINCCDMIAMKREVAARVAGFPWSECQVRKLTTSHCTETEDHEMVENNVCVNE